METRFPILGHLLGGGYKIPGPHGTDTTHSTPIVPRTDSAPEIAPRISWTLSLDSSNYDCSLNLRGHK